VIDVGNSGTSLYLLSGIAALQPNYVVFTGDSQIRSRPAAPLLDSLNDLGARTLSSRGNGAAPYLVGGPLSGGKTEIACPTSQYLSSLLLAAPLATGDTEIVITLLNEQPYAEMTLSWLDNQGIEYVNEDFERFAIPGGQRYRSFSRPIPGDFSSATFFFCAAAVTGATVRIDGLDFDDSQGDKAVVDILERLGCAVERSSEYSIIRGRPMKGCEIDLNATPDALPALAVTAAFAEGTTKLVNVPQARLKETDRITVMREELTKMGASVEELPDGLIIHGRPRSEKPPLKGAAVDGRGDHRVVMALAVGALAAEGATEIDTVESVDVTVPGFFDLLESITEA
jgi:3-phosphoshikimate 1-carboxyvinyltransferase